ncbi:hypothetical protein GH714_001425 [Hevea brasiliensis]|uniref:RNA-binding S4 domain-containing protein n=1 Tax=Hevea brasiliensis TaxID=3981 RepID=A0A6A6M9U8_HEVBR|nr:hypothetical protein GH714_001425 [Hevea brasiliensis]
MSNVHPGEMSSREPNDEENGQRSYNLGTNYGKIKTKQARFAEDDFLKSLPKKLILGLFTLFFSVCNFEHFYGVSKRHIVMVSEKYFQQLFRQFRKKPSKCTWENPNLESPVTNYSPLPPRTAVENEKAAPRLLSTTLELHHKLTERREDSDHTDVELERSVRPNAAVSEFGSFCSTGNSNGENQRQRINYAGMRLEETVEAKLGKLRLDSWISSRISGISRARIQSSIKSRLVSVNGRVVHKVSHNVKAGDKVSCTISELQPLRAEPEDIPLDIVYEDEHLLVVNKPPHMPRIEISTLLWILHSVIQVVHPAPGNPSGTLVNGILHHCSLPTVATSSLEVLSDMEDISDDEGSHSTLCSASVRPGSSQDEHAHVHLSEQFQQHTIQRIYVSLTSGVPSASMGRIDIPIGRDVNNRIRMTAIPGPIKQGQARHAASRYKVIEILAGGGSALVEWRLETGRTHQIRAHAKYIGIPLLGSRIHTQEEIHFSRPPPPDFAGILSQLREMGMEKFSKFILKPGWQFMQV